MVRAGLRRDIGTRLYDQWIRTLNLGSFCPVSGTLDLESPSDFSANYVSGNFTPRICLAWRAAQVGVRDVRIVKASGAAESVAVAPLSQPDPVPPAMAGENADSGGTGIGGAGIGGLGGRARRFEPRHDFPAS